MCCAAARGGGGERMSRIVLWRSMFSGYMGVMVLGPFGTRYMRVRQRADSAVPARAGMPTGGYAPRNQSRRAGVPAPGNREPAQPARVTDGPPAEPAAPARDYPRAGKPARPDLVANQSFTRSASNSQLPPTSFGSRRSAAPRRAPAYPPVAFPALRRTRFRGYFTIGPPSMLPPNTLSHHAIRD